MAFYQAVVGGRSVGTPGVLRMLALAHRQHGKLPWAQLFEPAIRLADDGFALSPRLHALLTSEKYLASDPGSARVLLPGTVATEAHRHASAQSGARRDAAYARARRRRGFLSWPDRRGHRQGGARPRQRRHLALAISRPTPPRNGHRCAATTSAGASAAWDRPPPARSPSRRCSASSPIATLPSSRRKRRRVVSSRQADAIHLFSEAGRLAFADRNLYVADPDFVAVDARALLDRITSSRVRR